MWLICNTLPLSLMSHRHKYLRLLSIGLSIAFICNAVAWGTYCLRNIDQMHTKNSLVRQHEKLRWAALTQIIQYNDSAIQYLLDRENLITRWKTLKYDAECIVNGRALKLHYKSSGPANCLLQKALQDAIGLEEIKLKFQEHGKVMHIRRALANLNAVKIAEIKQSIEQRSHNMFPTN